MNKLIELWKNGCEHCEEVKPIVEELEKEGYQIEKYNIEETVGFTLMNDYMNEIDINSEKMGYEKGFIYTPTFINPNTRMVLAFEDRSPTKDELINLANGGDLK